jgi:SLT domain-containing protein
MSTAASSVGQFVAGFGRQLVTATRATVVWIAEHTAAAATFIAENVAQAASATAAFVAENLATLGIVAGIALLVTAIVYLATHWKQVWADIEKAALWLWHNVLDPMWQGIEAGASWLYTNAIKPVFTQIKNQFDLLEQSAMWLWHNVFDPLWHGIEAGARGFVSGFKTIWSGLESVFKTPVNFLITTVYTKGIEELWNKVVGAVGLGKLHLPDIPHLAGGGVIGGYAPGRDTVPAMLSPGEGVLVPEAVRAIGPGTVHQLNASYGGGRKSTGGHYAGGGIVGSLENAVSSAAGKAVDIAKITAALGTGDTTALVNALSKLVSTTASGNYGQLLLGVPKTLISKMAQMIKGLFSGSSSGGGTSSPVTVSGSVASWFQRAVKLTGVGAGWIPDLETIAHYESSDNPNAIQQVTDVNSASGDLARGIMQTIMATFQAYHQPGTSSNIFDPVANIAASINYIKSRYGNPANTPGIRSLASGGGYRGYDSGGWLMPGDMPVNGLSRPEAVLTPDQSEWLHAMAQNGAAQRTAGTAASKQVTIQFMGTQYPNAEQMAAIQRQMALALGGAS